MPQRTYIRDKRSPTPKNEQVSKVMSANKAKDTRPEQALRKALWQAGIRGYRLHPRTIPGRPDIAFIGKRLAIFVNGCFWHHCSHCGYDIPKTNSVFWQEKFARNTARDKRKTEELEQLGWRVLTIWECELKKDMNTAVELIHKSLR